ncbi:hypothetical protein AB0C38_19255 [Amycolatopsis sp. NPDC048633]|uniref:Cgl0159 family (beta/alpha)8-fold protein n=1 Tax=Amycolatopsis sp. NPDC048633 TaxID=3157095 RepID=UPI0033E47992
MILTDERWKDLLHVRAGADWEIDDRFTGYDARTLVDGGKMLRLVDSDPGTVPTLQAAGLASWGRTLRHDVVRGLVLGRTLLYPSEGNTRAAVEAAAKVLEAAK